jgi:dephospho-CoA kinase
MHIAITGNIGSGKSTVLKILEGLGYPVFDADVLAKNLYEREDVKNAMIDLFGSQCMQDNQIDKQFLASRIFMNSSEKEKVEAILYPLVFAEIKAISLKYQDGICFTEVPLLYESHAETYFDLVLLIQSEQSIANQRLIKMRQYTQAKIDTRLKHQWSLDQKVLLADDIIINNHDETQLIKQVIAYSDKIKREYGKK